MSWRKSLLILLYYLSFLRKVSLIFHSFQLPFSWQHFSFSEPLFMSFISHPFLFLWLQSNICCKLTTGGTICYFIHRFHDTKTTFRSFISFLPPFTIDPSLQVPYICICNRSSSHSFSRQFTFYQNVSQVRENKYFLPNPRSYGISHWMMMILFRDGSSSFASSPSYHQQENF